MHHTAKSFKYRSRQAIGDERLKAAIRRTTQNAIDARAKAVAAFPQYDAARRRGKQIKDHVIANLDFYLRQFEQNAVQSGAKVHWARTAEEACNITLQICRDAKAKRVTRSKSMLGEEIGLPHALDRAGYERVETDLAEHIVQLADEPPSHIVWPAMHKTREEVAALFRVHHEEAPESTEIADLVQSARHNLREKFLTADVGITGANFLIADTGAVCTVTNEGNAELTTTPPRVHVVTAGIEKLVPSIEHAFMLLRLLVRSATGADITQYTTFHCGPKREQDRDGPEEFHIILVDNGRSGLLGGQFAEMLRCLRCGACMNHCVVFRQIGGHAYGGTYPGPVGAVLTPHLDGLKSSQDLPHACTLNGKCAEVCPVEIPLPDLMRQWRNEIWRQGLETPAARWGIGLWALMARRPTLYHLGVSANAAFMRLFRRKGRIRRLPLARGWTRFRDFPIPARRSFMQLYQNRDTEGDGS